MEIIAACVLLLTIALIFGRKTAAKLIIGGLWTTGGIIVLLILGGLLYWGVSSAIQNNERKAFAERIREDFGRHAPGRNVNEKWVSEAAARAQERHLSDAEIDEMVKQGLSSEGITLDQPPTQQELAEELRKMPPDQIQNLTKFIQLPEAKQQQILATMPTEHDRALIEEFKRERSIKGTGA